MPHWMKKIILVALVPAFVLMGYFALRFLFPRPVEDIRGDAQLMVTVLTDGNEPLGNIEVDVGRQPGPPPVGGVARTDGRGVATFSVKPGQYAVYFNTIGFPANLVPPVAVTTVDVAGGAPTETMVIVQARPMETGSRASRPGEFGNGQQYLLYNTDDFEVKYPHWPNVDRSALPEPERTKVAVSNEGCTFIINTDSLPQGMTFKEYTESRLREQTGNANIRMTVQDIGEKNARLEGDMAVGTVTVKSATYAFLTGNGQYYGIGFAAPSAPFEGVCRPLILEVLESVRVR